ncbi:unnamed protein product [Didymodactylos carnosus]|uniref:glycerophosphodiester phosphodiesterase n=1 Tax=Didymodactylos carnosus TaxID=1234261 RepID=A0A814MTS8_9BILA|nr:unnamed protein product [Didymodactylos carnosus]CAF1083003.1 unnamed protein product [Didymodactylos carnosus]CAF3635207.1 unnamed protein product [Didymodactylos carnosus]CAF3848793.1 unnamed protein product [Didymodactylos carnosus]
MFLVIIIPFFLLNYTVQSKVVIKEKRPIIIAHRGAPAHLPELTIPSEALSYGFDADIIEIDICLSKDDQLIVIHDLYLDSVTNVRNLFPSNRNRSNGLHYVIDFTLSELRTLSIHERFNYDTGKQIYPKRFPSAVWPSSFKLSTLNETLELLLGLNYATNKVKDLLIEIKKPEFHEENGKLISKILLELLNSYNITKQTDPVIIQTFHIPELYRIRNDYQSNLRLFALFTWNFINESSTDYDIYRSEAGIKNLSTIVQAITPIYEFLVEFNENGLFESKTNLTDLAHKYNLAVYPFTFREDNLGKYKGTFIEFVNYFWNIIQIDGFITDHSNLLIEHVRKLSTNSDPNPSTAQYGLRKPRIVEETVYLKPTTVERPVQTVSRPIVKETIYLPERQQPTTTTTTSVGLLCCIKL